MKDAKIVLGIVAVSLAILVGGLLLVSRNSKTPSIVASQAAKTKVEETTFSWGTISMKDGKVDKTFTITNIGSETLQLANVITSCMCTEAQVEIEGQKSPYFGMHQNSSWLGEIPAGKEAKLIVTFDPAFHGPQGTGQITRLVSLETNDQSQPKIEFTLSANVTN